MNKHIAKIVGSLVLFTVLLTACAGSASSPAAPAAEEVVEEAVAAPLRVGIPIYIGDQQFVESERLAAALEAAEEKFGIILEPVALPVEPIGYDFPPFYPGCPYIPHSELYQDEFDLYLVDSLSAQHVFNENELVSAQEVDFNIGEQPYASNAFKDNGANLGIVQGTNPLILIYNKEIFDELGISTDDDFNWDQMIEVARYIDSNSGGDIIGLEFPVEPGIVLAACQAEGGSECNEEMIFSRQLAFSSDFIDQMSLLSFYFNDRMSQFPDSVGPLDESMDPFESFANNKIAMTLRRSKFRTDLVESGHGEKMGVMPFPAGVGETHAFAWVVPATSQDPGLAWQVANFLTKDENAQAWMLENGYLPADAEISQPAKAWQIPNYVSPNEYAVYSKAVSIILSQFLLSEIGMEETIEKIEVDREWEWE